MNRTNLPARSLVDRHAAIWPAGAIAGLLSMAALVLRGRAESGSPAAPLNAVSHWVFGRRALHVNRTDWRHTALGALVHIGSSLFWAAFYDRLICQRRPPPGAPGLVAGAAGITALAALTDFKLVPERLTPGFEHRLSTRSLVLTYALFAAGLALGGLAARRGR